MGLYLELKAGNTTTKHGWLEENATETGHAPWPPKPGTAYLAEVSNPHFEAVAVIFSKAELRRCQDGRPDAIYWEVEIERLPKHIQRELK